MPALQPWLQGGFWGQRSGVRTVQWVLEAVPDSDPQGTEWDNLQWERQGPMGWIRFDNP